MQLKRGVILALVLASGCGGDSPTSSGGATNIAGNWTYRQQAPANCPLPTQHRNLTLAATLTAQGGNAYNMALAGTDANSSYSFLYWTGTSYRGSLLYTRTTASEFVVFSVNDTAFSVGGSTISASAAGEYQYAGATLVDCIGTFTITLTR